MSGERALQALADAVGDSRPRRPEDIEDADVPVAATVVLLRDTSAGPEVLLIERPDRGSFAGAWVFPGGKVDPEDAGDTEPERARAAGVRETREETGLHLDAADLQVLSQWDPPPGLPLRIRTWFFLARDPGGELALAADEAVASAWRGPADVLAAHGRGEIVLYPPTWVTLHDLSAQADVDDLLAVVRLGGLRRFETVARRGSRGPMLLWRGDAEYEGDAGGEAPATRHRLDVSELPWVYTRSD